MKKRSKLLRRLLVPVMAVTLALSGVPAQGVQMAEAAEIDEVMDTASGRADRLEPEEEAGRAGAAEQVFENVEEADGEDVPERMESAEEPDAEDALQGIERAEKADTTDTAGTTDGTDEEDEPEQADKAALAAAIQKAEGIQKADYSAESWENLQEALAEAKETYSETDADQYDVDAAVENLEAAMEELVKVPGKPGSVKVTWKGGKKVSVTWKRASDATAYRVYRSFKSKSSGFKQIAEVGTTSYTDLAATPGKTAYYKIVAVNDGAQGAFSSVKSTYVVKAPTKVKAKLSKKTATVSFKASTKASGYEIWSKTDKKSYKKAATLTSKKSVKKQFKNLKGGTHYYKVRAYKKSGGKKIYSDFGKEVKVVVALGSTIENTNSKLAIEGDIKLSGTGTGYHAKLVMQTPHSAVSFGIQYDQHAVAPYTGKAMALIENVSSNNVGEQTYSRPGNKSLKLNKTYHYMITVDEQGNGNVYLDYEKIGSFSQPNLANELCYLRIEACARLNGDSVKATFSNVKCKWNGVYNPSAPLGRGQWSEWKQNPGLNYKYDQKKDSFQIYGTVQGINGDWDSDYESVSYCLQFQSPYY